jgi:integrase
MLCRPLVSADVLRVVNATTLGDLRPDHIKLTHRPKNAAAKLVAQKKELARRVPNAEAPPETREKIRIAIQQTFTHLINMEEIVTGKNPAAGVPKIVGSKRKKKFLPWRHTEQLLAHVPKKHSRIFRFALGTGIRKGEALPLGWTDLLLDGEELPPEWADLLEVDDLDGAEAMPEGGYAYISKSHLRDGTKAKKDRVVPIPEWLAAELRLTRRFSTSQFVFPDENGEQQKRWVPLHDVMRTALKDAGLVKGYEFRCVNRGKTLKSCGYSAVQREPSENRKCPECKQLSIHVEPVPIDLTFRHLRSSYAMELLRSGGSNAAVAKALGNTEKVVAEHYAGLIPQELLRQANKLRLGPGKDFGRNLEGRTSKSGQFQTRGDEDGPVPN